MVMLNQRHIYLNKYNIGKMYTGTFVVAGAHTLQVRALRGYLLNILEYFVNYVICDLYLKIGREFMKDERKDSGENKDGEKVAMPRIEHSQTIKNDNSAKRAVIEEIKEFAFYLFGLILGAAAFMAFFYATVGTYKLSNGVSIPPDIAFVFKWVAYWFLFCGACCALVFVTTISYDFIKMSLRRKRRPKT